MQAYNYTPIDSEGSRAMSLQGAEWDAGKLS